MCGKLNICAYICACTYVDMFVCVGLPEFMFNKNEQHSCHAHKNINNNSSDNEQATKANTCSGRKDTVGPKGDL